MKKQENRNQDGANAQELILHNKSGAIPDDRKLAAKQKSLDAMSRMNIITASADAARVSTDTIWRWRKENFITEDEIARSYHRYQDMIRGELTKRIFLGTPKPALSNGRLVYDHEGQQVMINVVDNRLLEKLATKHLPEWKEAEYTPISEDGIPDEYRIVFDLRIVTREEADKLRIVAQAVYDRTQRVVNADSSLTHPDHSDEVDTDT